VWHWKGKKGGKKGGPRVSNGILTSADLPKICVACRYQTFANSEAGKAQIEAKNGKTLKKIAAHREVPAKQHAPERQDKATLKAAVKAARTSVPSGATLTRASRRMGDDSEHEEDEDAK
jgi:transcriptional/translational regulatory protein YebC/TACO1